MRIFTVPTTGTFRKFFKLFMGNLQYIFTLLLCMLGNGNKKYGCKKLKFKAAADAEIVGFAGFMDSCLEGGAADGTFISESFQLMVPLGGFLQSVCYAS